MWGWVFMDEVKLRDRNNKLNKYKIQNTKYTIYTIHTYFRYFIITVTDKHITWSVTCEAKQQAKFLSYLFHILTMKV